MDNKKKKKITIIFNEKYVKCLLWGTLNIEYFQEDNKEEAETFKQLFRSCMQICLINVHIQDINDAYSKANYR